MRLIKIVDKRQTIYYHLTMEYYFEFSYEKNNKLLEERGISFEQIIVLIESGCVLDIIDHPNQVQYPKQKIYIIDIDNYCYLVPHTINSNEIFLKTIIPSRKATKNYIRKTNMIGGKNEKV